MQNISEWLLVSGFTYKNIQLFKYFSHMTQTNEENIM